MEVVQRGNRIKHIKDKVVTKVRIQSTAICIENSKQKAHRECSLQAGIIVVNALQNSTVLFFNLVCQCNRKKN